jgi:hypothetical protein
MSLFSKLGNKIDDIGKAIGKMVEDGTASEIGSKIGKVLGKGLEVGVGAGVNIGAKGVNAGLGTVNTIMEQVLDEDSLTRKVGKGLLWTGKKVGGGVAKEAYKTANAGVNGAKKAYDLSIKAGLLKRTGFDTSLVGHSLTGRGKAAVTGVALIASAATASKDYLTHGREGRNDGQTYRLTPTMTNPYDVANQMMGSTIGQSFNVNAGADGDLVRAVHNMR